MLNTANKRDVDYGLFKSTLDSATNTVIYHHDANKVTLQIKIPTSPEEEEEPRLEQMAGILRSLKYLQIKSKDMDLS